MASDKTRVACPATALNVICMMHDDVYGPGKAGLKTAPNVIFTWSIQLHKKYIKFDLYGVKWP